MEVLSREMEEAAGQGAGLTTVRAIRHILRTRAISVCCHRYGTILMIARLAEVVP